MRLLLDTHIFIWYVTDNPKLSATTRALIDEGDNDILLSIVSIWEIAIKQSAGKLCFALPFGVFIEQQLRDNSIELLNINLEYIEVVESLPFHHRDPFDRLIIAQAMVERIPVLSADAIFDAYPIRRLW